MNLAEALQYLEDLQVSDSSENDLEIEQDASIDNLSGNQLLAPASLVVKDLGKGEIHVEQNIDREEKEDDPDLIVLAVGQTNEKPR